MNYRAKQDDVLDAICAKYYGVGGFDIGTIYDANPGLADLGAHIPTGTLVILPDTARIDKRPARVRLWD